MFRVVNSDRGLLVKWIGRHNKVKATPIVAYLYPTTKGYALAQWPTNTKAWRKLGWELVNTHHYAQARQSIFRQIAEKGL